VIAKGRKVGPRGELSASRESAPMQPRPSLRLLAPVLAPLFAVWSAAAILIAGHLF
jgi:hypothetical protein